MIMRPNQWSARCANGACADVMWQTACQGGGCVEVGHADDRVLVRDSKLGEASPVLVYPLAAFDVLIREAIIGGRPGAVAHLSEDRYAWVGHDTDGHIQVLLFDTAEIVAFVDGARAGQFRTGVAA